MSGFVQLVGIIIWLGVVSATETNVAPHGTATFHGVIGIASAATLIRASALSATGGGADCLGREASNSHPGDPGAVVSVAVMVSLVSLHACMHKYMHACIQTYMHACLHVYI